MFVGLESITNTYDVVWPGAPIGCSAQGPMGNTTFWTLTTEQDGKKSLFPSWLLCWLLAMISNTDQILNINNWVGRDKFTFWPLCCVLIYMTIQCVTHIPGSSFHKKISYLLTKIRSKFFDEVQQLNTDLNKLDKHSLFLYLLSANDIIVTKKFALFIHNIFSSVTEKRSK